MGARALLALIALGPASSAWAFEASLYTRHRAYGETLPADIRLAQPPFGRTSTQAAEQARALAYQAQVLGRIAGRPADWLGLELGLDTGLLAFSKEGATADGAPIGERILETFFLGETFAELQLGEAGTVQIRVGKLLAEIAGGAVYDGYGLGVDLDVDPSYADPEQVVYGHLRALLSDATFTARGKRSPLFELELGLRLGEDARAAMFAAVFNDGGDDLADVVRTSLLAGRLGELCMQLGDPAVTTLRCEAYVAQLETRGYLGWTGVHGQWRSATFEVRGAAVLGFGSVRATLPPGPRGRVLALDVGLSSVLGTVEARWQALESLRVSGFGVVATGDDGIGTLARASYTGFIGLSPRLPLTSIFYGGGLATTLQSPSVSAVAPDGSGLLSAGLEVAVTPWGPRATFGAQAAVMMATHPSATGGLYGVEVDARAEVSVLRSLELFASGGVFVPGSYYGPSRVGGQLIAGAALSLGD